MAELCNSRLREQMLPAIEVGLLLSLHHAEKSTVMTIIKKLWGEERVICNGPLYCAKVLSVKDGYSSSLHYHPVKHETFHVLKGSGNIEIGGTTWGLIPGSTHEIRPGVPHKFWVPRNMEDPLEILEISTHHDDADVVRIEPSRKL